MIKRLLPHRTSQRLAERQQLAKDAVLPAAVTERQDLPTASLRPELLAPVLDPQQLLDKLSQPGGIRDRHAARSAELSRVCQVRMLRSEVEVLSRTLTGGTRH